jgi:hypothetical protein
MIAVWPRESLGAVALVARCLPEWHGTRKNGGFRGLPDNRSAARQFSLSPFCARPQDHIPRRIDLCAMLRLLFDEPL